MQDNAIFTGGFADPVFAAQSVFRAVMDGMAEPGRVRQVDALAAAPADVPAAMAALALTLLDHDTPVAVSESLAASSLPAWLAFHTGAPLARTVFDAAFALCLARNGFPSFEGYTVGSDEYPDRSATLIVEVASLHGGPAMVARGPGIRDREIIEPAGLPADFLDRWRDNGALFPRGIDLVLVEGERFLCLPRTTRLEALEG